ncbi:MAG: hypothetical protein ISS93_01060 [Candidatus Aenigmarchaeota archaeon]|nr:hypothetical protein [Candidatus Aenigmarchaeota archaeon]
MENEIHEIEKKIFSTFAEVASSIGYSPLHGQIIGVLLVKGKVLSLQEIARETGYSSGMISLSLDLLEVLGVVKKIKKTADRKLYVELSGDLLECLKNAITLKLSKSISSSLTEFEGEKKKLEKIPGTESERVLETIQTLENEIKRLRSYVDLLSKAGLP